MYIFINFFYLIVGKSKKLKPIPQTLKSINIVKTDKDFICILLLCGSFPACSHLKSSVPSIFINYRFLGLGGFMFFFNVMIIKETIQKMF